MTYLVYDGQCPVCNNYVRFLELRKKFPEIELLDARQNRDHPAVIEIVKAGYVIDEGMVLVEGDNIHYGADAIYKLSEAGESWFSKINNLMFRSKSRSNMLYPLMMRGRSLLLKILGIKKIGL